MSLTPCRLRVLNTLISRGLTFASGEASEHFGHYSRPAARYGVKRSPPATRTEPSGSVVAVLAKRYQLIMFAVTVQVPVAGDQTSPLNHSPATSTRPSASNAAPWRARPVDMFPVSVHLFVAGS